MTSFALIVKHQTQPGKRDEVRKVWEKHMAPAIAANPGHTAYFYCFDNSDPDSISAFQQYASAEASQEFLKTDSYAGYLKDVEPLLAGPPQVPALTPVWSKEAKQFIQAEAASRLGLIQALGPCPQLRFQLSDSPSGS